MKTQEQIKMEIVNILERFDNHRLMDMEIFVNQITDIINDHVRDKMSALKRDIKTQIDLLK